jgi:hypothetical protein
MNEIGGVVSIRVCYACIEDLELHDSKLFDIR